MRTKNLHKDEHLIRFRARESVHQKKCFKGLILKFFFLEYTSERSPKKCVSQLEVLI